MKNLLISFVILGACVAFAGEDENKQGIRVVGECEREIKPDRVFLNFGIEVLKDTVKDSTELANKRYNELLAAIKKMGLKDAQFATSEYSSSPYRVWENKRQVLKGYQTRIALRVETSELDRAGEILQSASKFQQESIQGPNPFVSKARYRAVYRECLEEASADANQKAALLAKALKIKLGKVFDVVEAPQEQSGPRPAPYMAMSKSVGGAEAAQIEFGKETVKLTLAVSYYAD